MSDLTKIVDQLSTLTVMQAAELSKLLEEKWGVSAAAGDKKIEVIKEVRAVRPDLGLKEAKDLVDGAPQTIKSGLSKADAEAMKAKFEAAGAKIDIK